ncbi:LacI family transcriptional regulator [bacterium]|nr:MAG: LacI family transcriptional regulator [bacterium]
MPRSKNHSAQPQRVTMRDIAEAAGVHVMTVSNALGDTRSVAPETREKVQRIARELNYIPNTVARALAKGRTGVIAVVCGAVNEPYYGSMVHYLETCMNQDDYRLTLLRRPHDVMALVNATGSVAADGAIAIDMYHLAEEFRSHPTVPCVSIGTFTRSLLDYVVVDLGPAVEEALEVMYAAGRRRIAYVVNAPYLTLPTEVRAGTYLKFMERVGLAPEFLVADTSHVGEVVLPKVGPLIKAYIEENGCPDALLCLNDETAMSAYRVLRDLGRRIPDDVLMVGCDGQLHMEYFDPPLSTVSQPMEEMCIRAWEFLRNRMANPGLPLQHASLQGELIIRGSLLPQ